ncbi:metal ABC transporter ATP-binding protein [Treponema pedis]|uniref:ABC transporter ATP-binding protein n=5 Tax=Treponema pedis TaxID=409322 RepID=S6A831_9SPIR|nr:metal ABC transporter ATP-binding protein [Treponema pedis]AGT43119.1 ABC transporter ATP-binding protein [Treponema pedis str. T A4]QOW60686.1 metal ABC transporter ATP-binding protein [Treponema pedis]
MIKIESLGFKYPNTEKLVLKNINLAADSGEYISIVGENGCGKSTLIKLILKLINPSKGTVKIETNRIGYLPQKKENLNDFPITVFEVLDSYRRILKIKDKTCIHELLKTVNLIEYKNARAGELSGGQLQKLYIARAMIGNPELLILDEPSTGIDVNGQKEIYSFVKKLNTEYGLTVLSVDHNLDAAIFNSTKIFHIKNGEGHLCNPKQYTSEFFNPNFINFKPMES